MIVFVLAVATAIASSFVCSISEAVLLSVSHAQIAALGKSRAAEILRRYKREIDLPIAAILTLNTTAHTIGASVAGAYYGDVFDPKTLWVFSVLFTLSILLFSEIIPKTFGVAQAGRLATPVAYGVAGLVTVLKPFLKVTRFIARSLSPTSAQPVTSLEEIRLLASLGRTEGVVGALAADMIEGVATLRELRARDVMVPRARVVYHSGQRTLAENHEVVRRTGHSRFPYAPTGDLDGVEGVILVKDLMFTLHEAGDDIDLEELVTTPLVIPSATTLERLLRMFQQERRHLALVVDEYGGAQGIVTLEDVLEEIVGEIEDESDRVDPFFIKRSDGSVICRGWAEARTVLDGFGVEVGDLQAVTVGGLVAEARGSRAARRGSRRLERPRVRSDASVGAPRRTRRDPPRTSEPDSGSNRNERSASAKLALALRVGRFRKPKGGVFRILHLMGWMVRAGLVAVACGVAACSTTSPTFAEGRGLIGDAPSRRRHSARTRGRPAPGNVLPVRRRGDHRDEMPEVSQLGSRLSTSASRRRRACCAPFPLLVWSDTRRHFFDGTRPVDLFEHVISTDYMPFQTDRRWSRRCRSSRRLRRPSCSPGQALARLVPRPRAASTQARRMPRATRRSSGGSLASGNVRSRRRQVDI